MNGGPLSSLLVQVIGPEVRDLDAVVSLKDTLFRLAPQFTGSKSKCLKLFQPWTDQIRIVDLLSAVDQVRDHDSVVRDVLTSGHLAKLFARVHLLSDLPDMKVVGLPNQVFDEMSQTERATYFSSAANLGFDGGLESRELCQRILDHEARVLKEDKESGC